MCDFMVCNVCVCFAPINCENAQLLAKIGDRVQTQSVKARSVFKINLHKCFWERRGEERAVRGGEKGVGWDILTTHLCLPIYKKQPLQPITY